MASTAEQIQARIVLRVGDTPAGTLAANIAAIWDAYADKAQIAPRLQELYAEREAVRIALGAAAQEVDFASATDIAVKAGQWFTHLQALLATVEAQIGATEQRARGQRGGVLGAIAAVAPEVPPPGPDPAGPLDANAPRYQGDPYYRLNRSRGDW